MQCIDSIEYKGIGMYAPFLKTLHDEMCIEVGSTFKNIGAHRA